MIRLQVQERITKQIATALMEILQPQGVAVVMEAAHMCMCMRYVDRKDKDGKPRRLIYQLLEEYKNLVALLLPAA